MKKYIIYPLLFILLGCLDLYTPLPDHISYGYLEADVNGKPLSQFYKNAYQMIDASEGYYGGAACPNKLIASLSYTMLDPEGTSQHMLGFDKLPLKAGRYEMSVQTPDYCDTTSSVNCSLFTDVNGDEFDNSYAISPSPDNFFKIESYNERTREIKGSFAFTMISKNRYGLQPSFSKTLHFSKGNSIRSSGLIKRSLENSE